MDKGHEELIQVLQSRSYEALSIKRYVRRYAKPLTCDCWLVVRVNGKDRCFVNRFGKRPDYHHVWQIRKWLRERFGIAPDSIPVDVYDHRNKE